MEYEKRQDEDIISLRDEEWPLLVRKKAHKYEK